MFVHHKRPDCESLFNLTYKFNFGQVGFSLASHSLIVQPEKGAASAHMHILQSCIMSWWQPNATVLMPKMLIVRLCAEVLIPSIAASQQATLWSPYRLSDAFHIITDMVCSTYTVEQQIAAASSSYS